MKATSALDDAQLIVLGNDIRSRAAGMGWNLATMAAEIAIWYNQSTDPVFTVWRTVVSEKVISDYLMESGAAIQLDNLTAGKRESLLWAFGLDLDMSIQAVRNTVDNFCGAQNNLKAAIKAISKRAANRIEKLLATGTGTTENPGTLVFEGTIMYPVVEAAIRATGVI